MSCMIYYINCDKFRQTFIWHIFIPVSLSISRGQYCAIHLVRTITVKLKIWKWSFPSICSFHQMNINFKFKFNGKKVLLPFVIFCWSSIPGYRLTAKFCTCHDSNAVMACVKFCSDCTITTGIRAIWCSYSNLIYAWKIVSEMGHIVMKPRKNPIATQRRSSDLLQQTIGFSWHQRMPIWIEKTNAKIIFLRMNWDQIYLMLSDKQLASANTEEYHQKQPQNL